MNCALRSSSFSKEAQYHFGKKTVSVSGVILTKMVKMVTLKRVDIEFLATVTLYWFWSMSGSPLIFPWISLDLCTDLRHKNKYGVCKFSTWFWTLEKKGQQNPNLLKGALAFGWIGIHDYPIPSGRIYQFCTNRVNLNILNGDSLERSHPYEVHLHFFIKEKKAFKPISYICTLVWTKGQRQQRPKYSGLLVHFSGSKLWKNTSLSIIHSGRSWKWLMCW